MSETSINKQLPILQLAIGSILLIIEVFCYIQRSSFGDFYLVMLVPGIVGIFLISLGLAALIGNKTIKNMKIIIILILACIAAEILILYLGIGLSALSLIELASFSIFFATICLFFAMIGYYNII